MRSRLILTSLLLVMFVASLATPLVLAQQPEEVDSADSAQPAVDAFKPCVPVDGVDFSWEPETGIAGEDVSFTAMDPITGSAPFDYTWDFGDEGTGTGMNATHAYAAAGVYTVTLMVENKCGEATMEHQVEVAALKIVDVTYTVDELEVVFDTTVSGPEPITYTWDFGDGGTSDLEDPTHVYTEAGCYTVTLVASNAGGTDSWTEEICVAPCVPVEGADFYWEPETGIIDEPVTFYATVMTGTEPFTYTWAFGDGTPVGMGISTTHTYAAEGVYTVTLTVENKCGEAMMEHQVEVAALKIVDVAYEVNYLEVVFDATVSGAAPITYTWDFGDGGTSRREDPTHVYTEAGCYTVTLVASNAGGTDSWTEEICVAPCVPVDGADFYWQPELVLAGDDLLFTATVITGTAPFSYTWDLGDGGTGTGITTTHTYTGEGVYTVTLTVENDCGMDTAEHVVTVKTGTWIYIPVIYKNS
jgi:PKD repeat protein